MLGKRYLESTLCLTLDSTSCKANFLHTYVTLNNSKLVERNRRGPPWSSSPINWQPEQTKQIRFCLGVQQFIDPLCSFSVFLSSALGGVRGKEVQITSSHRITSNLYFLINPSCMIQFSAWTHMFVVWEVQGKTPCQTKITAFDLPSEDHSDGKYSNKSLCLSVIGVLNLSYMFWQHIEFSVRSINRIMLMSTSVLI